jgi:hypothetical protein
MCNVRSQSDNLDLPTGAGHLFIICRRRPRSAGMIPPNAISWGFLHPDFAVSSPYAAKLIPHELERKGPSASDLTGLRQQNGFS